MKTTLNQILAHAPCGTHHYEGKPLIGFRKLQAYLGPDFGLNTQIPITTILDSNGLDDALWCLRAVDGYTLEKRALAYTYALNVVDLWEMPAIVKEHLLTHSDSLRMKALALCQKAYYSECIINYAVTAAREAISIESAAIAVHIVAYVARRASVAKSYTCATNEIRIQTLQLRLMCKQIEFTLL